MTPVSRRSFMGFAAAAAGATAAFSVLPESLQKAVAAPAATGTINDVQHVVIFMQENRAFDHYYGTMNGVRGFGDRNAVNLPSGKSVFHQPYSNTDGYILPFRMDTGTTSATCANAPAMSYPVDTAIWHGGKYDAWNTARTPGLGMGYFNRADLPFYYALADAFTICDHYFCSTLTQTNPNRLHLFTGSNGLSVGQSAVLDNTEPAAGFSWTTYAERLEAAGISWKVYQQSDNFDDNALAWFANFKNAKAGSPLHDKGMATVPDLVAAFQKDVDAGTLPQVSWIVAPTALSEHANYKPAYGEDLSARLLKVLAANQAVWSQTAFILNYDENGGFFDHVPPPVPPATATQGISSVSTAGEVSGGQAIGMGPRVPLIVVSPWTRGGYVNSQVFDHTSVIRFLEKRFGVQEPNISAWRRAVSGDLTSVFGFSGQDATWPTLPDTSTYVSGADTQCGTLPAPVVPATQAMPAQEPGTRPARALPWQPNANGRTDCAGGKFWIDMTNTGTAGVVYYVYPNAYRTDGPWLYTVGAGATVSDNWVAGTPTGAYDLSLYGPNGFHRRFAGNRTTACASGAALVEVASGYDTVGNKLQLAFTNTGGAAAVLTVTDHTYGTGGPWTYTVPAGTRTPVSASFATKSGWYDLTVTADTGDGFLRRLAGHIETGADSITDPGPGGAPAATLVNGTFEAGSLTGWTVAGSASATTTATHSGTYAAMVGATTPTNGDSSVSQTFTAPSGTTRLSFWYRMTTNDTVAYDWATASLTDNTTGTSTTVLPKTCTDTTSWAQVTAAVTAGHSYTLTLTNHDDNYSGDATYTLYDDVTLS
ncbi:phosphocholine-specific phospholipase C [Streptomyces rubellomurinus]|uniref:phosphocholine-specific phospholipase C n=1 Tax=Streptomyces rubellomurinus (strain ATCC 31215) TaxID=359131 RepID=UPI00099B7B90|nr:phospholipase C, phosphocholine-specific [Streptomyces rubellomurinus]